jgi:hypothetical membrane protein
MLPYQEFFTSIKGIAITVCVAIVLFFLLFREINKHVSEAENETIEINEINIDPTIFESNCLRITGKQCPKVGK